GQEGEHAVGGLGGGAGAGRVVVQHRVDHGGMPSIAVVDHVSERGGRRIVEALHLRVHGSLLPTCLASSKLGSTRLFVKTILKYSHGRSTRPLGHPSHPDVPDGGPRQRGGRAAEGARPSRAPAGAVPAGGGRALGGRAPAHHLAVLRAMSLVRTRRESQSIFYSLAEGPAASILDVLYAAYCAPVESDA